MKLSTLYACLTLFPVSETIGYGNLCWSAKAVCLVVSSKRGIGRMNRESGVEVRRGGGV